jgi:hypothetical protein
LFGLKKYFFEDCNQDVGVDASFMGLIEDKDIEVFFDHELSYGHTIGHEGDFGLGRPFLLESDIVADFLAEVFLGFKGNSFGESDGADSSGLGDEDSVVMGEEVLWYLGGFTGAGLSANDGDLISLDGFDDLVFEFEDGESLLIEPDSVGLLLLFWDHLHVHAW